MTTTIHSLTTETATYQAALPQLLAAGHAGRHIAITGTQILGTYREHAEAVTAAVEQCGMTRPYLVCRIQAKDLPQSRP